MHRFFLVCLLLSCVLLSSCDEDCRGFKLGKEFEIALNETLENCPKNISVTITEIQDSRCSADLVCIWAGMIVVEGTLQVEGKEFDLQLSSNQNASGFPNELSASGYTIKLIDVIPYPEPSSTEQVQSQRAVLVILKN